MSNPATEMGTELGAKAAGYDRVDRDMDFIRNLLFTLHHSRGFLSITDQYGMVIDLTDARGDYLYDIEIKEDHPAQNQGRTKVKKIWGNEYYYKALIGAQERTIQDMKRQLEYFHQNLKDSAMKGPVSGDETQGQDQKNGNSIDTTDAESEIQEIINLMETTCQRYPEVYFALREQAQVTKSEKKLPRPKSPRTGTIRGSGSQCQNGGGNPNGHYPCERPGSRILDKMLDRCKSRIPINYQHLENCNPSLILCPQTGGGRVTSVTPAPKMSNSRSISLPPQGYRGISSSDQNQETNLNFGPNGARATTPSPQPGILVPNQFDIPDFEKFIEAAVLHVRGRQIQGNTKNISHNQNNNQKMISVAAPVSPRNPSSDGTTPTLSPKTSKKKNRKIKNTPKKTVVDRPDQGDNDNSFTTPFNPIHEENGPSVPGSANRPPRPPSRNKSRAGSPVGQSCANTGTQSMLTLTPGGTSASGSFSSSLLENAQKEKNRSIPISAQSPALISNNSSFPPIVVPVKRPHSDDAIISCSISRSQSLPSNANVNAAGNNANAAKMLLATSSLNFKTGRPHSLMARALSSSPGPSPRQSLPHQQGHGQSQERSIVGVDTGSGGTSRPRSDRTRPTPILTSTPLLALLGGGKAGNNPIEGEILRERKQKGGNSTQNPDLNVPVFRKSRNLIRPKTAGHAVSTSTGGRNGGGGFASVTELARAGMSCPYCLQDFDKNMSPDEVRTHLEKHVFHR